jgi:hypothetical protein
MRVGPRVCIFSKATNGREYTRIRVFFFVSIQSIGVHYVHPRVLREPVVFQNHESFSFVYVHLCLRVG